VDEKMRSEKEALKPVPSSNGVLGQKDFWKSGKAFHTEELEAKVDIRSDGRAKFEIFDMTL
jgi:hypothetical protein